MEQFSEHTPGEKKDPISEALDRFNVRMLDAEGIDGPAGGETHANDVPERADRLADEISQDVEQLRKDIEG